MKIAIAGLSITSSWGNGHATTYRGLVKALAARGHDVVFLERDVPWYAENRDLPHPPYCRTRLYLSVDELERELSDEIASADLVVLGSYVPDGIAVADAILCAAQGCTAFYDIDTPVTLSAVEQGTAGYLARRQIPAFDLYLSFTGGPTLTRLEQDFGAQRARALYCAVDADLYSEDEAAAKDYDLGYLGTYSDDRQPSLDELLIRPARRWPEGRFVVAGPQYPESVSFPGNVRRTIHLSPGEHRRFYNRQRFTLNITRKNMIQAGYSPSVRLFEAAACATPIVSDAWPGLETFLSPGAEILIARDAAEVLGYLRDVPEPERIAIGRRARARVLRAHTATHRAIELEGYVAEASRVPIDPMSGDMAARIA